MKFKGVSEKLINNCFDEIEEADYDRTLMKIYDDYYQKQRGLKEYQKKSKAIKYLLSRGFEYDEIIRNLSNFIKE